MCEKELQVININQSKSILDYDYELHGPRIKANKQIWPASGQKVNISNFNI